jgi:hypothetical protein
LGLKISEGIKTAPFLLKGGQKTVSQLPVLPRSDTEYKCIPILQIYYSVIFDVSKIFSGSPSKGQMTILFKGPLFGSGNVAHG